MAVEAGPRVKPPVGRRPRQHGRGFSVVPPRADWLLRFSRAFVKQPPYYACAAAQAPLLCKGGDCLNFDVVFVHPFIRSCPVIVTVFGKSWSSVTGTLEAVKDS